MFLLILNVFTRTDRVSLQETSAARISDLESAVAAAVAENKVRGLLRSLTRTLKHTNCAVALQALREIASNAQAAAATADLQAKQQSESRNELVQQLEFASGRIASLMEEGSELEARAYTQNSVIVRCRSNSGRANRLSSRGIESQQDKVDHPHHL